MPAIDQTVFGFRNPPESFGLAALPTGFRILVASGETDLLSFQDAVRIMAKDLVRTRGYITKFCLRFFRYFAFPALCSLHARHSGKGSRAIKATAERTGGGLTHGT